MGWKYKLTQPDPWAKDAAVQQRCHAGSSVGWSRAKPTSAHRAGGQTPGFANSVMTWHLYGERCGKQTIACTVQGESNFDFLTKYYTVFDWKFLGSSKPFCYSVFCSPKTITRRSSQPAAKRNLASTKIH